MVYNIDHQQACCESVYIEDVVGDINDILNSPILRAEERTDDGRGEASATQWTFYELATIKGSVTIRWYGMSNGYYSVSVTFERVK